MKKLTFRRETTHLEKVFLDYLIHVFILVAVLSAIFFFFISKIEREALNKEVDNAIVNALSDITVTPDAGLSTKLLNASKFFEENKNLEKTYNDGLENIIITILLGLLFALGAVYGVFILSVTTLPPLFFLIARNIMLFLLVGIVEYLFFVNIASKYIPIEPSYIEELLKEKLNN